jgi:hypothetical protein
MTKQDRAGTPRKYLNTEEAADYLGLKPRTLSQMRWMHTGPAYSKLGGKVVYNVMRLDDWANDNCHDPKARR